MSQRLVMKTTPLDLSLELQMASELADLPVRADFERWLQATLEGRRDQAALTIRVVDEGESQELNLAYRQKDKPTNVLSFPFEVPAHLPEELRASYAEELGDLVICAPVVAQEANDQRKLVQHHWAHMVIHGTLHLLGYDHIEAKEAEEMESLETAILDTLAIADPYAAMDNTP